jgi:hypothetical protein
MYMYGIAGHALSATCALLTATLQEFSRVPRLEVVPMVAEPIMSREARIVSGVILLTVPTIMYGGLTLLGILTGGTAGLRPDGLQLSETQWALFRAGHAHAGVWVILSLIVQVLLDSATLGRGLTWVARLGAPLGAVAISGGFFGLAFVPGFRWPMYMGAAAMAVSVLVTGIGLLRRPPGAATR